MSRRWLIAHLPQLLLLAVGFSNEVARPPCKYDFSVYVYPLSADLSPVKFAEEARKNQTYHVCRKCIYEQFALEYVVYDFFTQFCGRTYNPEEADYFYLPIVRDIDYRIALQNGGKRNPSLTENALLEAIEKKNMGPWKQYLNVTDRYWKRNGGADHIIAMPAPVTNFRHQSSMRGFFHYMIQLESPIFLNVEFSRSFVKEYPLCAKEKNIVMPYPTTDPEVLKGQLLYSTPVSSTSGHALKGQQQVPHVRDKLLFYQGGRHGSCEEIRNALAKVMTNRNVAAERGNARREEGFKTAKFCPIPIGDSPSSKRMYDVMHYGCVPVVLSDDLVWAYSLETGGFLDPGSYSIRLPQKVVQRNISEILSQFNESDLGLLPSGISIFSVLLQAQTEIYGNPSLPLSSAIASSKTDATTSATAGDGAGAITAGAVNIGGRRVEDNPLVEILMKIPHTDLLTLQMGVNRASSHFRYYQYNSTMRARNEDIPTSYHKMPDGDAIEVLAQVLSLRKKKGILAVNDACQAERQRPNHNYIGTYPCDRDPPIRKKRQATSPKGKTKKQP